MDLEFGGLDYRPIATGVPQLVFGCRRNGDRTWPSPQWTVYTGLSAAQSVGFGWLTAIHPDDRPATLEGWAAAVESGGYQVEHRIRHATDGVYRWHQTRAVMLSHPRSAELECAGSSVDIDDLHALSEERAAAERNLRAFIDGVPQLLWRSCDQGEWTWASPQWLIFTGQRQEESHGRGWLDVVHPEDREATMDAWTAARPTGQLDVDFRVRDASDKSYRWHRTRSNPARDVGGRIVEWFGTTTDVQELKALQVRQGQLLAELETHAKALEAEVAERGRAEAKLLHDAQHDNLTQLHNRAFFMERVRVALQRCDGDNCAVLLLDLDRFKLVNDSLGHRTGDLLLIEIASRLTGCARPQDTLARFGGDEFAFLIEGADAAEAAMSASERITEELRRPLWLGEQEVFTSCSIGLVCVSTLQPTPEAMLRDADIAMYYAKSHGLGYAVFTEAMYDAAVEALRLRTDLRNAIERGELRLHYQPICAADTGQITGVEALVRWQHATRGMMPPGNFITIAEETGLIRDIGRWVLLEACTQVQAWRDRFPAMPLRLNVNISGVELKDPRFEADLRQALADSGFDPRSLQLEVTESIFLEQPELTGTILDSVRALGVKVALDDFGTGYSSLSYLDRYQFDTIKIDRSFVSGVGTRPRTLAIVQAIVRLGQAAGLEVVAEGVEDRDQLVALRNAGCGLVQGYFLGRPAPGPDMIQMLERLGWTRR